MSRKLMYYFITGILAGVCSTVTAMATPVAVVPQKSGPARRHTTQTVTPLAFAQNQWMRFLQRAWTGEAGSAAEPVQFRRLLAYLRSESNARDCFQFPDGKGPPEFRVMGWTCFRTQMIRSSVGLRTRHGKKNASPSTARKIGLAFLACRRRGRFMLLINFSGQALAYFCSVGNRRLAALITSTEKGPEVRWTRSGGFYFHLFASQKKGGDHGTIKFGYYSYPPVKRQFKVGPCELALFGLEHSTGLAYDATRREIIAVQELTKTDGAWMSARFDPSPNNRAVPRVVAIQQGTASVVAGGHGIGAVDSVFLFERQLRGRDAATFNTSLRALTVGGVRTMHVGPKRINTALQGLYGPAPTSKQFRLSRNAKRVTVFLQWVGGGALEWYRSPNAKYVRTIVRASLTPLGKAKRGRD